MKQTSRIRRRCQTMLNVPFLLGGLALILSVSLQAQDVQSGGPLFDSACAHCHGANGQGAQIGPSIVTRVSEDSDDELIAFLRTGNPERGMPPAAVSDQQLPQLVSYMRFLAAQPVDAADLSATGAGYSPVNRVVENFVPIDDATLLNPSPDDWLSFSRTVDAQRFSPLDQINTRNVGKLALAWSRGLPNGLSYTIPVAYNGILYLATPQSTVIALDATTGDQIWEYRREFANPATASQNRAKTISLFADMVYFTAPDSTIVALDARTGALRWEAPAGKRGHSSGSIVVKGKVVSAGNCVSGPRDNCFISAHDAYTGELLWKFNTVQADDQPPGIDTWAGVPLEDRLASPWGLPGSYDPANDLIYWGIANPMPTTRNERHAVDREGAGTSAPADLYSNSTVALNPDTGALVWYYQHLPGDDWDLDMNEERTLVSTVINPDPDYVKWINPNVAKGTTRDVVVNVGEGGGIWLLDRKTGEFIWSTPFPFDVENYFLRDIDVETGKTYVNTDLFVDEPGERHLICYLNTRSFWPTAYLPTSNSLYVPYIRNCLDMTAGLPATATTAATREKRVGAPEPGVAPEELNGLAKVNLETGAITHWPTGRIPNNSAMLATAGNLIFWGDLNRRYQAWDADTGEVLWETLLGGPVSMSNITYAVDGRQYVAVIAGETLSRQSLSTGMGPIPLELDEATGAAAIYVFALPQN